MPGRDPFGTRQCSGAIHRTREGSGAIHRTIYNSRVHSATTFDAFNLRVSAEIPLLDYHLSSVGNCATNLSAYFSSNMRED